jgi:hypothetical protein
MWRTTSLALLLLAALALPASAAAEPLLVPVGGTFDQPVHVTGPPLDGSRLFVTEKGGVVRVIKNDRALPTPFLDISEEVADGSEQGLLSLAFHPDYAANGLFYVYLTAAVSGELQVREYRRSANPEVADEGSLRVVWRHPHDDALNHNGGLVAFGPDGYLWLAPGDGGGSGDPFDNARDFDSHLGKVLRIDPRPGNAGDYTIPADNPTFEGRPPSAIWSYGLRNPFRFSFDRANGDLFIGDVGQSAREEIDWAPASEGRGRGADYGWPCREGTVTGPRPCTVDHEAYIPPIWDYLQSGPRAVTGGYVIRDPGLPSLAGRYVYADTYTGQVRSFVPARPRATGDRAEAFPRRSPLVSFGEDGCGHVYVVSLVGSVERIQDGALGPCVPPAGSPPPPPAPPARPSVPDRSSPRVSIRIARKGRVGRRATPRIRVVASENCRVLISARTAGTRLKRVRTPLRAGRRTIVRLRPTVKGVRRIRGALRRKRRITMVVSVRAVDAAGNVGRVQRRMKLRRA